MLTAGIVCVVLAGEGPSRRQSHTSWSAAMKKLRPLHEKISKPGPGDWLAQHKEPGQTFTQYQACGPVRPTGDRRTIYIQPLGDFTKKQREVIKFTAEYMGLFFNMPVATKQDLPLSVIPAKARRVHPSWGDSQILTTYVLYDLLKPKLPKSAACAIAFTSSDLWPGKGWNFVFGQASIKGRVGVWSIYRNGDPAASEEEFKLCLMRTIKTGVHETAHMLSMLHCTKYECCMCGSNHREESDRRPVWLCPECVAKVCWATETDMTKRYRKLAAFWKEHGFEKESTFFEKSAAALTRDQK